MYSEPTFPWLNGDVLFKRTNPVLRNADFVLEEASYANLSLGISVVVSMEQLPGLSAFMHVSARNSKRDLNMDEIKYLKDFLFGVNSFVKVTPTRYTKSRSMTFHMVRSSLDEVLGMSPN